MAIWKRLKKIVRSNVFRGMGPEIEPPDPAGSEAQAGGATLESDTDPELAKYYANLEIPYGSDVETARKAWKQLLKKYHPDIHNSDPEKRRIANEVTAELTKAIQEIEKFLTT